MPIEDVDDLFAVRPDEFVRARDELAGRLKTEGRADEAGEVKRLRRPGVVVWALNQLARHDRADIDSLLATVDEVRAAQEKGDGAAMRRAGDDLHRRVSALAARAGRLVVESGVAAAGREPEIEAALRAAALGGAALDDLRAGRLVEVPEADAGLGMWVAVEPEARPAKPADRRDARLDKAHAEAERARARVERAEDRVAEVEAQLGRERAALAEARAAAREAEREVERLMDETGR